jgi:membrane protein required for colicin V production
MNVVDLALLATLILFGVGGFFRGFVQSILGIAVWVGSVFATVYAFPFAVPVFRNWIANPTTAAVAAGAGVFVASLVVLYLIRNAIGREVRSSALSSLDRSLGFVFGLGFGATLICLTYFGLASLANQKEQWPDWALNSKLLPIVARATLTACSWGPQSVREQCARTIGREDSPEDIKREVERLTAPPTRPGSQDGRPGYSDQERREMDRLMRTNR